MPSQQEPNLSAFDAALAALSGETGVDNVSPFDGEIPEPKRPTKSSVKRKRSNKRAPTRKPDTDTDSLIGQVQAVGTAIWGFSGMALVNSENEQMRPVGSMMQLQAPAAGKHIGNIVERTPIIGWLTPLLDKKIGVIGDIAALVTPPLLVMLMSNNPVMQEKLAPFLGAILVPMAKDIVEAQENQSDVLGMMSEMDEKTMQLVNQMMENLFVAREQS